jgi:DNA (cytosine-5)-methyltransferase 1
MGNVPNLLNFSPMSLSVIDFFSGSGGMSAGFAKRPDDFTIIGAVDKQVAKPGRGKSAGSSTKCNPTYAANVGVTPKEADLATLDPVAYRSEMGLEQGDLDVLISCAPCTGFSQKNANNHVEDDPRNQLVRRTGLYVEELMPKYLVMENVKELLNGAFRFHFQALRKHLESLGYSVWAEVHDLSEYGLPQRRIRALVIARRDGPIVGPPLAKTGPVTVRETIAHLPPLAAGEADPHDPQHRSPSMSKQVLDRIRAIPRDGGSWADVMNNPRLTDEEKRYLLIPSMFRARPGSFPDVYGRLWWDRPAITITRECAHVGNGRYAHPEQDRLLTVREMSLLQGFPPDYEFVGPLAARYNQIGDSVPPMISRQIADHIASIEAGKVDVGEVLARRTPQLELVV